MSKKKSKYTAASADKYELYELSVQCVEADIDFVTKTFRKQRGRKARLLKEDFCGSAAAAAEFVRRHKENRAWGVDLDKTVLKWGRKHRLQPLGDDAKRITLLQENVLHVNEPKVDLVLGMNFSYFIFKTREDLRAYFRNAWESLVDDGMLMLDSYGGWEAQEPQEEIKEVDGFDYVWDQDSYDPITSDVVNHIHFRFPDGTEIHKAFTYEWRLWTLKEIQELLYEAGFANVDVYWEGWDEEKEEGDGVFKKARHAESCPGFIAYIIAEK